MGGLFISDIGFKYENKIFSIFFIVIMEFGFVGFSFIGFVFNMELISFNLIDIRMLFFSLEGFLVVFECKFFFIVGIICYGKIFEFEYYVGGFIVGWMFY